MASLGCPSRRGNFSYTYDGLDRQRTHTYSAAHGRAAAGATTSSHYDGSTSTLTAEVTAGLADLTYQLGPDGNANGVSDGTAGGTDYLIGDGVGHTTTLVDQSGTLTCTSRSDPYGSPQNPVGGDNVCNSGSTLNETWYAGSRRDSATGAYQLGARTYSPGTATFSQADTMRTGDPAGNPSSGGDALTANTYNYVNGDPINASDPTGHNTEEHYYGSKASTTRENANCTGTCKDLSYKQYNDDQAAAARAQAQREQDARPWYKKLGSLAISVIKIAAPIIAAVVVGGACAFATGGTGSIGCAALAGAAYGAVDGAIHCGGKASCIVSDIAIGAVTGAGTGLALKGAGMLARAVVPKLTATVSGAVNTAIGRAANAAKGLINRGARGATQEAAETTVAAAAEGAGRARAFQFGDLPSGTLGSTDELGNITIQRGLTGKAFTETLRHETVHSVLTPPAPLNRLTVGLYGKSGLYRYAEKALAEGYATRSIGRGLAFPIAEGYVSIPRLAMEAGGLGAVGFGAYQWAQ
jgi:RHS repeat-associated protein